MKISYNWLENYLNVNLPAEEVAALLTDIGLEVEGIEKVESIKITPQEFELLLTLYKNGNFSPINGGEEIIFEFVK